MMFWSVVSGEWSVVRGLVVCSPPWHHRAGQHRLHNFAALILRHIAQANDSVFGFRARWPQIDNLRFDREDVARSHHIRPSQFIDSKTDGAFDEVQCLHKQTHGHCRRMPAAGNQALENRSLGTLTAEMKHLWIKLVRKLDELLLRYI